MTGCRGVSVLKYFKTSEIARAVGVHPNTVRLYEEWGLLQPVPRNSKGYRLFTGRHMEQMRLARIALRCEFVEGNIRELATGIVKTAAQGSLEEALEEAFAYSEHIKNERAKAEEALEIIQKWIEGSLEYDMGVFCKRIEVAKLLGVSIDVLRNWERNGLAEIPRNQGNGYRVYGSKEITRLKVIRTLRAANYSMMAIFRMMKHIDMGRTEDFKSIIDAPQPEEDIVSAADRWISTLSETEQDAQELILQLRKMLSSE